MTTPTIVGDACLTDVQCMAADRGEPSSSIHTVLRRHTEKPGALESSFLVRCHTDRPGTKDHTVGPAVCSGDCSIHILPTLLTEFMNIETPKILAFAGSARTDSYNKRLARIAGAGARQAGARVTILDLREYPMPIFDGDLETAEGLPRNAALVREMMLGHDGFLIASPEYNGSVTPLLKNVIDWTSRAGKGEDGLAPYRNKFAVLMSASPGGYGGLRGLAHLRAILQNTGMIVLPDQVTVGRAEEMFTADGNMRDASRQTAVERLGQALALTIAALRGRGLCEEPFDRRYDIGRIG
jgi:chromate reductase